MGGGLYGDACAASIVSSTIRANAASQGGGAFFRGSNEQLSNREQGGINLKHVRFEENEATYDKNDRVGSALFLWKTQIGGAAAVDSTVSGIMQNVTFAGNRGGGTLSRIDARTPLLLCQPGHYMPANSSLTIDGDFIDCGSFPCAAGYFGREQELRSDATCDGPCPAGSFCPNGTAEPLPCPIGTSNDVERGASKVACRRCYYGQFQPEPRSINCSICPAGTYAAELGQTACDPCPAGGYCSAEGAATALVWNACPTGTFNPDQGSKELSSCRRCPAGTTQQAPGANSSSSCAACPARTYSSDPASPCTPCPYPLASDRGSDTCGMCLEGYYLKDTSADPSDIFATPTKHCRPCPPHADCSAFNTTLESLGVPSGFWRASLLTAQLYSCDDSDTCDGGTSRAHAARRLQSNDSSAPTGHYCAEGHAGPLCELCVEDDHYFSNDKRRCVACPSASSRLGILSAVVAGAALLFLAIHLTIIRTRVRSRNIHRLCAILAGMGLQAKSKITISFFQVCAVLSSVYGVQLHDDFTGPRPSL